MHEDVLRHLRPEIQHARVDDLRDGAGEIRIRRREPFHFFPNRRVDIVGDPSVGTQQDLRLRADLTEELGDVDPERVKPKKKRSNQANRYLR